MRKTMLLFALALVPLATLPDAAEAQVCWSCFEAFGIEDCIRSFDGHDAGGTAITCISWGYCDPWEEDAALEIDGTLALNNGRISPATASPSDWVLLSDGTLAEYVRNCGGLIVARTYYTAESRPVVDPVERMTL